MFTNEDMKVMSQLKDAFDTQDALNPGKIFPQGFVEQKFNQSNSITRAGAGAHI